MSFDKDAPDKEVRLVPSLLALKKKFEDSRPKTAADDQKAWITKLEDVWKELDEIELMLLMTNEDFMLHVMGNLPREYDTVFTVLENRHSKNGYNITIEGMNQKLSACYKQLKNKQEVEYEEENAMLAFYNKSIRRQDWFHQAV